MNIKTQLNRFSRAPGQAEKKFFKLSSHIYVILSQVIFSLGPACGCVITLSSYNRQMELVLLALFPDFKLAVSTNVIFTLILKFAQQILQKILIAMCLQLVLRKRNFTVYNLRQSLLRAQQNRIFSAYQEHRLHCIDILKLYKIRMYKYTCVYMYFD